MTRFLTLTCTLMLFSFPAFAKDDGGFGDTRFSNKAPTALGDVATTPDDMMKTPGTPSPASIEPAAGDEEDVQPPTETLDPAANSDDPSIFKNDDTGEQE
jgi:hypothetical protein